MAPRHPSAAAPRHRPSAAQPGRAAIRLRRTHLAGFFVLCPLISGGFFGVVAVILVHWSGSADALVVGAAVGGAMFVANAAALCVVHSISRVIDEPARSPHAAAPHGLRAS